MEYQHVWLWMLQTGFLQLLPKWGNCEMKFKSQVYRQKSAKLPFEKCQNPWGSCKERSAHSRYQRAHRGFGDEAASAAGGAGRPNCACCHPRSPGRLEQKRNCSGEKCDFVFEGLNEISVWRHLFSCLVFFVFFQCRSTPVPTGDRRISMQTIFFLFYLLCLHVQYGMVKPLVCLLLNAMLIS